MLAVKQSKRPNFPASEGCEWIHHNGQWKEINRDWLFQMLYPNMCIIQMSARTRILVQEERIDRENKSRMDRLGLSEQDLIRIREEG